MKSVPSTNEWPGSYSTNQAKKDRGSFETALPDLA